MKATGIVRRVDDLGRIVIPKEIRRTLKIREGDPLEIYTEKDGVWEGGSISMFSPVLKFSLFERFSEEVLEVSESMEVNGKKTFGYDVPILYRRS